MTKLLIREIDRCRVCSYYLRGMCRYNINGLKPITGRLVSNDQKISDWCPLPDAAPKKKMLMIEIDYCCDCSYCRDEEANYNNDGFIYECHKCKNVKKSIIDKWGGIPDWCPLPEITPDPET